MERIGNKVSYIRKSVSQYSYIAAGLAVAALAFTAAAIGLSYYMMGEAPLVAGVFGLMAMITAGSSVAYCFKSFTEKDKNYKLSKISIVIALAVLACWALVLILGM